MSDTPPPTSTDASSRKMHLDLADAECRIDGLTRDPQTDAVFAAYAAGDMTAADLVARLHTLLGL